MNAQILSFLKARVKEPSTQRALIGIATIVLSSIVTPDQAAAIAYSGIAIYLGLEAFLPDRKE